MNFNAFEPGVLLYTFYLFLLLLVTVFRYNKTNKENLKLFVFFVLIQVVFGGLRGYTVGTDTGSYVLSIQRYITFNYSDIIADRHGRDPYFYVFTKFITNINESYVFLFFVLQIIWWSLIAYIFYKYSNSCLLALLLMVTFRSNYFMWSGMRQGLAMAFIVFSFKYLESRKFIKYMVVIVLAALCHKSALVFIPVYFINRLKLNKLHLVIGLFVFAVLLSFILPDIEFEEDMAYVGYIHAAESMANLFSFVMILMAFSFIIINVSGMHLDDRQNLLFTLSLFTAMFSLMGLNLRIAYRMAENFCVFMPIIMSNIIMDKKDHRQTVIILSFVIVIIYLITGMPVGLNDYKFYWETNFLDYEINM